MASTSQVEEAQQRADWHFVDVNVPVKQEPKAAPKRKRGRPRKVVGRKRDKAYFVTLRQKYGRKKETPVAEPRPKRKYTKRKAVAPVKVTEEIVKPAKADAKKKEAPAKADAKKEAPATRVRRRKKTEEEEDELYLPPEEQPKPVKKRIKKDPPEEPAAKNKVVNYIKNKHGGYCCRVCGRRFTHRYKVNQHYKNMHGPREWHSCADCGKKYRSKYQCNQHALQHREDRNDYLYWCDKCDYNSKSKHYLKTHIIRKHTAEAIYECDYCGKRFKIKNDIKFHLGTHEESQHMCDVCGRFYPSQESLNKHRRVNHVNEYKFHCPICKQKLMTEENLRSHMKKHDQLFSCDQCDLKFTKKHYMTRHKRRVHTDEKNNLCPVCGKAFLCMSTLRVHYLTHAKVKPYICNICGFSFTQRSSMMLHWKRKHPDADEPPPPVILTNFFDSLQQEVNKLVQTTTATDADKSADASTSNASEKDQSTNASPSTASPSKASSESPSTAAAAELLKTSTHAIFVTINPPAVSAPQPATPTIKEPATETNQLPTPAKAAYRSTFASVARQPSASYAMQQPIAVPVYQNPAVPRNLAVHNTLASIPARSVATVVPVHGVASALPVHHHTSALDNIDAAIPIHTISAVQVHNVPGALPNRNATGLTYHKF